MTGLVSPAMEVSILRPWWPSDVPERERNHDWTLAWWKEHFPEWEIVEAPGISRAAALNRCAAESHGEILIKADVDCWCEPAQIEAAVALAITEPGLVYPTSRFENLSREATDLLFSDERLKVWSDDAFDLTTLGSVGGIYVVRRDHFEELSGEDERFIGWGFEDAAFDYAALTLLGPAVHLGGALWHLWHPPAPDFDTTYTTYQANRERCHLYEQAIGDVDAMGALVDEP